MTEPKIGAITVMAIFLGLTFLLFTTAHALNVDGYDVSDIVQCQKLMKEHRNYTEKLLSPISANYATPYFHNFPNSDKPTNEPESLAEIERKEEIKVRLTMQEFYGQINEWLMSIPRCALELAFACAKEPMKSQIIAQELQVIRLLTYYSLKIHSFAKINATEVYEKIAQDKRMLSHIETTQIDLCASGDGECEHCLEDKADQLYSEGRTCNSFRHWHIVRYAPLGRDNACRHMKDIYVPQTWIDWQARIDKDADVENATSTLEPIRDLR